MSIIDVEPPGLATGSAAQIAVEPLPTVRRRRMADVLVAHWHEGVVAVVAFVMNAWALWQNGLGNEYYAAAARSMTTSWHNFVFASYDPGGWITTDKPPLALWIQAASVKLFGLNSWSLLVPSAIAGALCVWFLAALVRRVWGRSAGLCAGVALALTPAMFAVSRSSNPDAILVLCMVAAAWAAQRAIDAASTRRAAWWIATAGALAGLGFLAKMLVAVVVLPAIVAAYVVGRRESWGRRVVQVGYLVGAFVAVGGAWVALMDLTSSSPWVGGSKDGSARDLVFGYNGFGRVFGNSGPGGNGGPGGAGRGPGGFGSQGGIDQFGGKAGLGRLFNNGMGDQVMWLVVVAAAALLGGVLWLWRRRRVESTARRASSMILLGGWAITAYVLFAEASGIFHNYYVSALAPALAGLVGVGVGLINRVGRGGRFVAALALAATAVLQLVLIDRIDTFGWLKVLVPMLLGIVALALVVTSRRATLDPLTRRAIVTGGLVALCLAPAIWVWGGLHQAQSATFPDARPANTKLVASGGPGGGGGRPGGAPGGGFGSGGANTELLDYLRVQTTSEKWILAVSSSMEADQAIIDGYSVMSMGGFSGSDAAMTVARLADLVDRGDLRFVSVGGGGPGGGPGGGRGGSANASVMNAVSQACIPLDALAPGVQGSSGVYDCLGMSAALRTAGA